ncbi:MAG: PaaI family thioesterase, partial [Proteobacteria bacterium]|nr:PaaI family thioesterase [Pseudomonadota bacterium]
MCMSMRPEFERVAGSGQFHGGVIAALIDTVGDYALIAQLGVGVPTINFSVDFLRAATGPTLEAVACVRRNGRTIGVVDIEVFDSRGALVAVGRGCYATQVKK